MYHTVPFDYTLDSNALVELARVEDGGTQEAEEDEAGDGASLDESLVRPLDGHVALETIADVPACVPRVINTVRTLLILYGVCVNLDHM